jgi:chaperonin cofactor prefoldin
MDKELINLRIQDLISKGKELEMQLHQINGAIQQCQWTLTELEKSDAAQEVDQPESV